MSKKKYAIAIPIYSSKLLPYQRTVIENLFFLNLSDKVIFIHPTGLNIKALFNNQPTKFNFIKFEDHYFKNIQGYNKLCLCKEFYKAFSEFDYLFIHQLDAFLLKNNLDYWVQQEYDYVGSPWVGVDRFKFIKGSFETKVPLLLRAKLLPIHKKLFKHDFLVGNGGFSLRKINSILKILTIFEKKASNWTYNEDLFYSLFVPAHYPTFKIPEFRSALKFSFDLNPLLAFNLNNHELPMAVHGFDKPDYNVQWHEIMKKTSNKAFEMTLRSLNDE